MAPFNTNYQVIWKNLSTEGVTFEESKTRNYTFREPDIAPRDQFLEDMGDEVARQFLVLNPNLPREAFTFQNLIDYVARVLQAGMIHWNEKPKRVSYTPSQSFKVQCLHCSVVIHCRGRQCAPRAAECWSRCQIGSVLPISGTQ